MNPSIEKSSIFKILLMAVYNITTAVECYCRFSIYFCTMQTDEQVYILAIESSCDETSAAISCGDKILANVIAGQEVHRSYGGVVPELASRAHQQNIVPVVDQAFKLAKLDKRKLSAVAFTNGPGLMGSLLVGTSFAKSFALGSGVPIIEVNHMQAHVLAHFAQKEGDPQRDTPDFPFLCLTVSGGHTQIVRVDGHLKMQVIGRTLDDAAGEAFDKVAKLLGLPYPGGPLVDKLAAEGDPYCFNFPHPRVRGFDYSFSGLKTAVMYFLQSEVQKDGDFIKRRINDICASVQKAIIDILIDKLVSASKETGISHVAIAGGVSANSGLRKAMKETGEKEGWKVFIPPFEYCTDNAAMVAITGYYKFLNGDTADQTLAPYARFTGMG
jgi:N6-L-threonylcarbamoyladenine synthase